MAKVLSPVSGNCVPNDGLCKVAHTECNATTFQCECEKGYTLISFKNNSFQCKLNSKCPASSFKELEECSILLLFYCEKAGVWI